jgi:hypothetical protein
MISLMIFFLTRKLLNKDFLVAKLKSLLRKFYGGRHTGAALGGAGPNDVLYEIHSALLCVLEQPRDDNSSSAQLAGGRLCHHDLVCRYGIFVSQMTTVIFPS